MRGFEIFDDMAEPEILGRQSPDMHIYPSQNAAAGITSAIKAFSGAPGTVHLLPGVWTVDAPIVGAPNIHLLVEHGAILKQSGAGSLNILGSLTAPETQWLSGFAENNIYLPRVTEALGEWFGALGDGNADDLAALNLALRAAARVRLKAGLYRITSPLRLPGYKQLLGIGRLRTMIKVDFVGNAIEDIGGNNQLEHLTIHAPAPGVTGYFAEDQQLSHLSDICFSQCDIPIHFRGACYENRGDHLWFHVSRLGGVKFDMNSAGHEPGNNFLQISHGSGPLDYATSEVVTCGLDIAGYANHFDLGEWQGWTYPYNVVGGGNHIGCRRGFQENCKYNGINVGANTIELWGSVVYGYEGKYFPDVQDGALLSTDTMIVPGCQTPQNGFASVSDLVVGYLFNEQSGTLVRDIVGKNHLNVLGAGIPTREAGLHSKVLKINPPGDVYLSPIPAGVIDFTEPFTVVTIGSWDVPINVAVVYYMHDPAHAGPYIQVTHTNGSGHNACGLVGTFIDKTSHGGTKQFPSSMHQLGDPNTYLVTAQVYELADNRVTNYDLFNGLVNKYTDQSFDALSATSRMYICTTSYAPGKGAIGRLSFFGVWQRKLSMAEVYHIANLRLGALWQPPKPTALGYKLIAPNGTTYELSVDNNGGLVVAQL